MNAVTSSTLAALSTIIPPWLALVALTWTVERWLLPKLDALSNRGWRANLVHGLTLAAIYCGLVLLTGRVGLSAGLSLALVALLMLVNNDKQRTLHEPFLACDFVYFWDAIKHPKLYLPYFGYAKAALLASGFVVLLVLWWTTEPTVSVNLRLASIMPALISGLAATLIAHSLVETLSLSPVADIQRLGLIPMLMAYRAAAKRKPARLPVTPFAHLAPFTKSCHRPSFEQPHEQPLELTPTRVSNNSVASNPSTTPLILCIQVESFVDFRAIYSRFVYGNQAQRHDGDEQDSQQSSHADGFELPVWDSLSAQAVMSGRLTVPAFGANTVRSEFEFLMGVPVSILGVQGFDPYQWIARGHEVGLDKWLSTSLPASLGRLGYKTSFVHPYDENFYQRAKVLPKLGFDEFIDIQAFDEDSSVCNGDSYVSDIALGRHLAQKIRAVPIDQTAFIHAVTMQGHGPYVRGRGPHSVGELFAGFVSCLRDTDQMLQELSDVLSGLNRPVVMCVFGDHVPIMPEVYDAWGTPDGKTNYIIWRNSDQTDGTSLDNSKGSFHVSPTRDLNCHELGSHVLAAAKLGSIHTHG